MSTPREDSDAELLARALDALERVEGELERSRAATREPIAITGLGCRFPHAADAGAFADLLAAGGDAVGEVPAGRDAAFAGEDDPVLRRGGFLADLDDLDLRPYALAPEEERAMDPHLRLLLAVAWQALADAGASGGRLAGTATGVYLALGAQNFDHGAALLADGERLDRHAIPGSFHSLMPGQLSYRLDLRGPSLVVDAACASGLVAVHLACQALRRGECDAVLAAAVNLVLSPLVSRAVHASGLWSRAGHCRSFDAEADGFVRGEGCVVLVLERLADARAAGRPVHAVIRGSAVGQDGRSNGLTAPNGPAQEAVLRAALRDAGLAPAQVGYVEAHATGTPLGDAIEAEALQAVYGAPRPAPLLVGALKPNLGHLEAAAGLAGLAKAVLALERRAIPPTLHHARLNPDVALAAPDLAIVTGACDWPVQAPFAGVSAFGMSGTNAHVIVGPAPELEPLPGTQARAGASFEPSMLAALRWRSAAEVAPRDGTGHALLLCGDAAMTRAAQPGLAAAGYRALVAPPTSAYLPEEAYWARALAAAPGADVVHFTAPEAEGEEMRAARARSLGGLLELLRALARQDGPPRRLFVVARDAARGAALPEMAIALGRAIALEHPDLGARAIELDGDLDDPGIALALEIGATDGETWIRRAAGGRLVPRIVAAPAEHHPFAPRADACYLVTGAFGGIGAQVAAWLVGRGARDLMLLGRHPRELPAAAAWRARGVRLRAHAVDVAEPEAIDKALASLAAEGVPLAGVFHAAGVRDDALLFQQDWPRFAAVLRAKVDGARALREATRLQPLDAFVLFSSVSAVTGLVGAGAYVAANAALCACARRWRAEGLPALAVLWGTWEGSGMAQAGAADLARHWEALGLSPFPPETGTAALEALLAAGRAEAIAARVDWPRLARWARGEGLGDRLYAECAEPAAAGQAVRALVSSAELPGIVRAIVAQVLGLRPDHPSLDRPFGELGLGSLAAIELRTQLADRLGIAVPATLAFNHPSVAAIASFLAARLTNPVHEPGS